MQAHTKRRVTYFYDTMSDYKYRGVHSTNSSRMSLTHNLISLYGLDKQMVVRMPHMAKPAELKEFHDEHYVELLRAIRLNNQDLYTSQLKRFKINKESPVYAGMYHYCQLSAGGSLDAATQLNANTADICINWSGGSHHAKKSKASGRCYVNDVVLAIKKLLEQNARVLYIDIDVHHGDGVEQAFSRSNRVLTLSFHKYGNYFPDTGAIDSVGINAGKYYAANVPLRANMNDAAYVSMFKTIVASAMERFRPSAVVMQCGADSLAGDPLGVFNLTLRGHGKCISFVKSYNLPLLLLGGGGTNAMNAARCWTYETALALDVSISDELPRNKRHNMFGSDFRLHIEPKTLSNLNTPEHLERIKIEVLENLRRMPHAPSVQMRSIPKYANKIVDSDDEDDAEDDAHKDVRKSQRVGPHKVVWRRPRIEDTDDEDENTDDNTADEVVSSSEDKTTEDEEQSQNGYTVDDLILTSQPFDSFSIKSDGEVW